MAPTTVEDEVVYHTGKAGDIVRQLGLAGLAVVWLFHLSAVSPSQPAGVTHDVRLPISIDFYWPVLLIILALALDALHYLVGSIWWGTLVLCKKGNDPATDHKLAVCVLLFLVIVKVALMGIALVSLLCILSQHIPFV